MCISCRLLFAHEIGACHATLGDLVELAQHGEPWHPLAPRPLADGMTGGRRIELPAERGQRFQIGKLDAFGGEIISENHAPDIDPLWGPCNPILGTLMVCTQIGYILAMFTNA
jgi:hypothetical protein